MIHKDVRDILLSRLQGVQGIPVITTENRPYQAKDRVHFVRFGFEPRETMVRSTMVYGNPIQELAGLVRISIFVPRGSDVDELYGYAGLILDEFRASSRLSKEQNTVHVLKSWTETIREEAEWTQLPVFVRWMAHYTSSL